MPERKHTAGEIINKWEMPLRAEIVCLLLLEIWPGTPILHKPLFS